MAPAGLRECLRLGVLVQQAHSRLSSWASLPSYQGLRCPLPLIESCCSALEGMRSLQSCFLFHLLPLCHMALKSKLLPCSWSYLSGWQVSTLPGSHTHTSFSALSYVLLLHVYVHFISRLGLKTSLSSLGLEGLVPSGVGSGRVLCSVHRL